MVMRDICWYMAVLIYHLKIMASMMIVFLILLWTTDSVQPNTPQAAGKAFSFYQCVALAPVGDQGPFKCWSKALFYAWIKESMACHEYRTTDDHAVLTCFLGQLYPVSDCSQPVPEDCFALRRKNHEACRRKLCHARVLWPGLLSSRSKRIIPDSHFSSRNKTAVSCRNMTAQSIAGIILVYQQP